MHDITLYTVPLCRGTFLPSLPPCCVIVVNDHKTVGELNYPRGLAHRRFGGESCPSRVGNGLLRPYDGDDRDIVSLFVSNHK